MLPRAGAGGGWRLCSYVHLWSYSCASMIWLLKRAWRSWLDWFGLLVFSMKVLQSLFDGCFWYVLKVAKVKLGCCMMAKVISVSASLVSRWISLLDVPLGR